MSAKWDPCKGHWVLWQDLDLHLRAVVQKKANWPCEFGGHVVIEATRRIQAPPDNPALAAAMFLAAGVVGEVMVRLVLADHYNIHFNANWAFRAPDGQLRPQEIGIELRQLHAHVYGRREEDPFWGDPMVPANFAQQRLGIYWDHVWSQEQLDALSAGIEEFLPGVLYTLRKGFCR